MCSVSGPGEVLRDETSYAREAAMKKILICTTQRSGSTMVCDDMQRVGLGRPDEHFYSWGNPGERDWAVAYDGLVRDATANGIQASKIMANKAQIVNGRFATFVEATQPGPYKFLRTVYADAVWLWLRRGDKIAQAISLFLAEKSGVFHSVSDKSKGLVPGKAVLAGQNGSAIPAVEYDFEAIRRHLDFVTRGDLLWSEFFRMTRIAPIVWDYESHSLDKVIALAKKMGVEPTVARERNLNKLPSERSAEMRAKFVADLFSKGP